MSGQSGLKTLLLVLLVIPLILMLILFQTAFALDQTVLSPGYFGRQADRYLTQDNLEDFIDQSADSLVKDLVAEGGDLEDLPPDTVEMLKSVQTALRETVDPQWLSSSLTNLIQGFLAYFSGRTDNLPTLDIRPLKALLLEVMSVQIKANAGSDPEQVLRDILDQAAAAGGLLVDGRPNPQAVDDLLASDFFESAQIERETAEKIVFKAGQAEAENLSDSDLLAFAITEIVRDLTGLTEMADELDFNALFETQYGSAQHPLTALRDLILSIRQSVFWTLSGIILALILLIGILTFRPSSFLTWLGAALLTPGLLVGLGTGISIILFAASARASLEQKLSEAIPENLTFVQDFVLSYSSGIVWIILIQAGVLILLGTSCLVGGHLLVRHGRIGNLETGKAHPLVLTGRIVFALILLTSIPLMIWSASGTVKQAVKRLEIIQNMAKDKPTLELNEALDDVLNTSFFSSMGETD